MLALLLHHCIIRPLYLRTRIIFDHGSENVRFAPTSDATFLLRPAARRWINPQRLDPRDVPLGTRRSCSAPRPCPQGPSRRSRAPAGSHPLRGFDRRERSRMPAGSPLELRGWEVGGRVAAARVRGQCRCEMGALAAYALSPLPVPGAARGAAHAAHGTPHRVVALEAKDVQRAGTARHGTGPC